MYADPDLQDREDRTALHHVFLEETDEDRENVYKDGRRVEIIRCLLSASADLSIKAYGNLTPLDLARARASSSPLALRELEFAETHRKFYQGALVVTARFRSATLSLCRRFMTRQEYLRLARCAV